MSQNHPSYLRLHTEDSSADLAGSRPGPVADFPGLDSLLAQLNALTGWQLDHRTPPGSGSGSESGGGGVAGDSRARRGTTAAGPGGDDCLEWSGEVRTGFGLPPTRITLSPGLRPAKGPGTAEAGPSTPGHPADPGLEPAVGQAGSRVPRAQAVRLAETLATLLDEWGRTRDELWRREAELAAGIPVAPREDERQHLAARLDAILECGAQAIGCQAAAAYLLDDDTSQLKLRACWGLPKARLLDAPRPLRGALADLEALMGSAVALENAAEMPAWQPPEEFPAALCVPISSPSTPLGTLWLFGETAREFTDSQTNLAEVIAGRLAAELEREVLLREGVQARRLDRAVEDAARLQALRLPQITPLLDDWQFAGWTEQANGIGGDFHDWTVREDGRLVVTAGAGEGGPMQAALTATVVQTAFRAHARHQPDVGRLFQQVHETLWTSSPGDQFASAAYAQIDPESGQFQYALAGSVRALIVRRTRHASLWHPSPLLGSDPDARFYCGRQTLHPGEILILYSDGFRQQCLDLSSEWSEAVLAQIARRHARQGADKILQALRHHPPRDLAAQDRTLVVVKRRASGTLTRGRNHLD